MFIERLQDLYIDLLTPWCLPVSRIPMRWRRRLITLCFFAIIVLFLIVRFALKSESYMDSQLVGVVLMTIIGILSLDGVPKRVSWHRSVFLVWMGLCLVMTVSDVLVLKDFAGFGIVLALVFPGAFFIWQNHNDRGQLWECFKSAVRLAFLLMAVLSFCFRPLYEDGRYSGVFTNPNTFGLYLVIVVAVFLSDLDYGIVTGRRLYNNIPAILGLGVSCFFLQRTQSRTSMVVCAVIGIGWLVIQLSRVRDKMLRPGILKNTLAAVLIALVLYPVCLVTTAYLPWLIGHPVVFEGETLYLTNEEMITDFGKNAVEKPRVDLSELLVGYVPAAVVSDRPLQSEIGGESGSASDTGDSAQASSDIEEPAKAGMEDEKADEDEPGLLGRFWSMLENSSSLNALFNWRLDIYKGYVERIDFVGHSEIALTVNHKRKAHAHNNWIQYGYTYGWFGLLFYGLFTVLALIGSLRWFRRNARRNPTFAFLVPAVCIGFVTATVTECLMLPFEVFPAFAFWFVCGEIFIRERKRESYE